MPAPDLRNHFALAAGIFLRLLALIHLIAFVSAWVQLDGLVGPCDLGQVGGGRWRDESETSDAHQMAAKRDERLLSLLLFAGVAPGICLLLLWLGYLSLVCAGQIFFNFQWDILLLETTLAAVFLAPWRFLPLWRPHEPPRAARLLLGWLLFRLLFLAGS